jgi:hypothetical protein
MLVRQMSGRWRASKGLYMERYMEAQRLAEGFPQLRFRTAVEEGPAHALAKKAYEEWCRAKGRRPEYHTYTS